jgi:hypothetical protein
MIPLCFHACEAWSLTLQEELILTYVSEQGAEENIWTLGTGSNREKKELHSEELHSDIPGSHGGEYEDGCLLDCCTVYFYRSLSTFQRCLLPLSSGRTHHPDDGGATTQKIAIFKSFIFCTYHLALLERSKTFVSCISSSEWSETRSCFITVVLQICLQYAIRKVKKSGRTGTEWVTSASGQN